MSFVALPAIVMLLDHSCYGRVNNKEQPWVPDLHRKTNDGTLELWNFIDRVRATSRSMISSYLVPSFTGRSPGFSPLRIRPT